jgi:pyruvate kinase
MLRKTKIVATLGPASTSNDVITRLITAGVDVVRLNFSHGTAEDHINRAELVRNIAFKLGRPVGILCDLQGPKIRIGKFTAGKVTLKIGDIFILDSDCVMGDQYKVGLDYKELPQQVQANTMLLLDDGRMEFKVDRVHGNQIHCVVMTDGVLSNNKGINLQGGGLSAAALTPKDIEDLQTAVKLEADYIAISFPKNAKDVLHAKSLIKQAGGTASIIAKIERAEAIDNLESIIDASDAIMVARGDLGVEVGDAAVPGLQKRMIRMARAQNKLVITATQMMESMILSPIPTRAEVSDVANAVLDGTDAVMLSAETAAGQYPIQTVLAVHRVCIEAEKEYENLHQISRRLHKFEQTDEAIAAAAIFTAQNLNVKVIAALTQSGNAAQWLSRADSSVPIYALSPDKVARRKLTLHRNVFPYPIDQTGKNTNEILQEMEQILINSRAVELGDTVILTFGEPIGSSGGTNTMIIIKIGERRKVN